MKDEEKERPALVPVEITEKEMCSNYMEELVKLVHGERVRLGIASRDVSTRMEMDPSTFSKCESGKRTFRFSEFIQYCKVMGLIVAVGKE